MSYERSEFAACFERTPEEFAVQMIEIFHDNKILDHIISFGIFGSATHSVTTSDIDFLLLTKANRKASEEANRVLPLVTSRIQGDYSIQSPWDCSVPSVFRNIINEYSHQARIDVDAGIGPAALHHQTPRWIHLNGPMSIQLWEAFCSRHPIHAKGFLSNYLSIYGETPVYIKAFSHEDIHQYINDMRIRIKRIGISNKYIRKLLYAVSLITGAETRQFEEIIGSLVKSKVLTAEQAAYASQCSNDNDEFISNNNLLSKILLEYISKLA